MLTALLQASPVPCLYVLPRFLRDVDTHICPAANASLACHKQERLQHALVQWQYPSAPLPHALLAAQSSTAAAAAAAAATGGPATAAAAAERSRSDPAALLLQERVQQWREALRAAYLALRHGFCPAVYICGQVGACAGTAGLAGGACGACGARGMAEEGL
jgi:hypothetical protein